MVRRSRRRGVAYSFVDVVVELGYERPARGGRFWRGDQDQVVLRRPARYNSTPTWHFMADVDPKLADRGAPGAELQLLIDAAASPSPGGGHLA